tara:strand:- start:199 stop:582 length:384 start_codon:yes stop_codon:yes gene_type:complete
VGDFELPYKGSNDYWLDMGPPDPKCDCECPYCGIEYWRDQLVDLDTLELPDGFLEDIEAVCEDCVGVIEEAAEKLESSLEVHQEAFDDAEELFFKAGEEAYMKRKGIFQKQQEERAKQYGLELRGKK